MTEGENDYPSVTYGDSSPDKGSLLGAPQKRRKIYESKWGATGASGRGRQMPRSAVDAGKCRAPQQGLSDAWMLVLRKYQDIHSKSEVNFTSLFCLI